MGVQTACPGVGEGIFLHLGNLEHLSSPLARACSRAQGPVTAGEGVSSPAFIQCVFSDLLLEK